MALGGFPIPPWLVTRPAEHAQASAEGLSAGLQAAHIWAAAAAESAKLEAAQRQSDMENALKEEALQRKSIYEAQALAVDSAKNQAAIGLAQAKLKDTQDKTAEAAQQWAQEFDFNQQKAADLSQFRQAQLAQGQQRTNIAAKNAESLDRYRQAMTDKKKAVSPLEAQLNALNEQRKAQPTESPGVLGTIKKFFTGGTPSTTKSSKRFRFNPDTGTIVPIEQNATVDNSDESDDSDQQ